MADTSNLSKFLTDVAQAIRDKKGSDAKIPAKNFDTEIADITSGVDTSDATATANDIVQGKSAYVDGSKIEGALQKGLLNNDLMMNGLMFSDTDVTLSYEFPETKVIESGDGFWPTVGFSEIANEQGVTSDMIVEGNRILGIDGTAKIGSGETGVKLFETIDEMQADTEAKEGDLALVYRNEIQPITVDSHFSKAVFPETVVLPSAMTDYADVSFRAVDSSIMFECWGQLDSSYFMMDCYTETGNTRIQYESSDGVTYNRTRLEGDGVSGDSVDFGTEIYYAYPEMWNDVISYFIQAGGMYFEGLYEYNLNYIDKNQFRFFNASGITVTTDTSKSVTFSENVDFVYYDSESIKNLIYKLAEDIGLDTYMLFVKNDELYTVTANRNLFGGFMVDPVNNRVSGFKPISYGDHSAENVYIYKLDLTDNRYELTETLKPTLLQLNASPSNYCIVPYDMDYCGAYIYTLNYTPQYPSMSCIIDNTLYGLEGINTTDVPYKLEDMYAIVGAQFTADVGDILPGKICYGKNGVVAGDDSVWDNLDWSKNLLEKCPTEVYLKYIQSNAKIPIAESEYANPHYIYDISKPNVRYGLSDGNNMYTFKYTLDTDYIRELVSPLTYSTFDVSNMIQLGSKSYILAYEYKQMTNATPKHVLWKASMIEYDNVTNDYNVTTLDVSTLQNIWMWDPCLILDEYTKDIYILLNMDSNLSGNDTTNASFVAIKYDRFTRTTEIVFNKNIYEVVSHIPNTKMIQSPGVIIYNGIIYLGISCMTATDYVTNIKLYKIQNGSVSTIFTAASQASGYTYDCFPRFVPWFTHYKSYIDGNIAYILTFTSDSQKLSTLNLETGVIEDLVVIPKFSGHSINRCYAGYSIYKWNDCIYISYANDKYAGSGRQFINVIYKYDMSDNSIVELTSVSGDNIRVNEDYRVYFTRNDNILYSRGISVISINLDTDECAVTAEVPTSDAEWFYKYNREDNVQYLSCKQRYAEPYFRVDVQHKQISKTENTPIELLSINYPSSTKKGMYIITKIFGDTITPAEYDTALATSEDILESI